MTGTGGGMGVKYLLRNSGMVSNINIHREAIAVWVTMITSTGGYQLSGWSINILRKQSWWMTGIGMCKGA